MAAIFSRPQCVNTDDTAVISPRPHHQRICDHVKLVWRVRQVYWNPELWIGSFLWVPSVNLVIAMCLSCCMQYHALLDNVIANGRTSFSVSDSPWYVIIYIYLYTWLLNALFEKEYVHVRTHKPCIPWNMQGLDFGVICFVVKSSVFESCDSYTRIFQCCFTDIVVIAWLPQCQRQ